jgi:hypothetical protein
MATFISEPVAGRIYIAEHSRKGSRKLLWSVMPEIVPDNDRASGADVRTEARLVPLKVRRQAYRALAPPPQEAVPWTEVDRETAYGSTVRLSRSIRVF